MADNSLRKGRYTKYSNKIGLFSGKKGNFVKSDTEVVLSFPFKDTVLEAGMSKEDVGREERFLHQEVDSQDIDTLEEPKVLTNFSYIDKAGEETLTANSDIEFFDQEGNLKQNLLIKGNNLLALHTLKKRLAGKVKLIYIDPPYNTGNDGFKYNDNFNHSAWLAFMKNRLEVSKDLLASNGSLYVHLDQNELHYCKVLLDEIFGRENFQRDITVQTGWALGFKTSANTWVKVKDSILFYSKSPDFTFNKQYSEYSDSYKSRYKVDEEGRLWTDQSVGRVSQDKLDELIKDGIAYQTKTGGWRKRQYLDDMKGNLVGDIWTDIDPINSQSTEKTEIDGQKSEKILRRIIAASTEEGDIVLDFCLGSGTTSAVAHKMNRRWVGIEQMDYIEEIAKERLKGVVGGEQGGVSREFDWNGGGSFVYFELKKYNQEYIDRIAQASTLGELEDIYVEMRNNAFLKFWFDRKEFEKDEDFRKADLQERKQKLTDILDENQLYLNYPDMDDTRHKVTADEKALTNRFYGKAENQG